ncbi:MAG: recombination protein NinG [Flavobacteriaceae bacterium]
MQQKAKNCKGINRAKEHQGCNTETLNRKFGLCPSCLYDWMTTTENGKIYYQKQFLPKTKIASNKNRKRLIKEKKISIMTADNYRKSYVQPLINKIARLIDFGHPCIATGNFGKMNGGHYRSVGSNRTLALNLHNIHIQSFESNVFRGGDDKNYQDGLKDLYGLEYFDFVDGLRKQKPINLSKDDLKRIKEIAQQICNKLDKNNFIRSVEDRIIARNAVNRELGIYDLEYSIYELPKTSKKRTQPSL